MDSRGVETSARTFPTLPIETADGSSSDPTESVFDWADKLLARYPLRSYEPAMVSRSSLCDLDSCIPPLENIGRSELKSGEAKVSPFADQDGFHGLYKPPDWFAAESLLPSFPPAASNPSCPSSLLSYHWSTSTPPPFKRLLPYSPRTAFVPPPPLPQDTSEARATPTKRTKIYTAPTSSASNWSSSSALLPSLYATTFVDPAAHAGGSISVEEAPSGGELEKVTWFPSFPGISTTNEGRHGLGQSTPEPGPTLGHVDKAAAAVLARNATTTTSKATAFPRFALESTDHRRPVPSEEDALFSSWTKGDADLLTLDGRQKISFSATISDPPNFDYDQKIESWVTYRRSQISFDISFGVPGPCGSSSTRADHHDHHHLCSTTSAAAIERFEVEVASWSNAPHGRSRKVDLHQLDKTRTLSRAVPLGRQVLYPRQPGEGSELDPSPVPTTTHDSNNVPPFRFLTTHFRRVHYARSTRNDLRHHSVRDASVVLRVSVLAIHMDASESVLGGWTSAPHLVRGRSRVQFGGGDGTTASAASSKNLATGRARQRPRNVKGKKKRSLSAEFIEDSDAEAEAGS